MSDAEKEKEIRPENIRAIRLGHGANCSSVGSVIDTLFLASAIGGAIFAAVCAALGNETKPEPTPKPKPKPKPKKDDDEQPERTS